MNRVSFLIDGFNVYHSAKDAPAIRTAADIFPAKEICFAFPYKRKNKELNAITSKSFLIRKERYVGHQLPDPFTGIAGRIINKPAAW